MVGITSNTFLLQVVGTHAHSWVMSYDTEHEAFEHYANALPTNCVFLVDTFDTISGVRMACKVMVDVIGCC